MRLVRLITMLTLIVISGCTTKQTSPPHLPKTSSEAELYYIKAFTLINESKDKEAIEWAERAAKLGHGQAQYLVGYMLHEGTAGVIHTFKAKEWYKKAADQGIKEAQFNLGVLAEDQPKIPRHFSEAHKRHKREAKEKSEEVNTIFIGQHMGYVDLPLIQPSSCFEPNTICMNHYVTYKIKVNEVIAGESLSGVVFASRLQHGHHVYSESNLSLFVVTKIKKKEDTNLLKADYFLRKHTPSSNRYCLSESLDIYIPELKEFVYPGCMDVDLFYGDIKKQFLEDVADKVEKSLKEQNLLISVDEGTSINGKFISSELEDDDCPEYYNRDKYAKDPRCNSDEEEFDVSQFIVKKGFGDLVKQKLKEELANTKINFQSVEMKAVIRETSENTLVEWHYLVKRQ